MPLISYKPFWSETAILWGAGATASLDVPTTDKMGKIIRKLAENKDGKNIEERINEVSIFYDIETELGCFLKALGDNLKEYEAGFDNESIKIAKKILPEDFTEEKIKKKILQWKAHYDWDALCCLAMKVPVVSGDYVIYIMDLYNIIDGSLLNNHGVQVHNTADNTQVFLYPHRLRAARNLLVLLSSLMMACAYHKTRKESRGKFSPYLGFVEILGELMQREAIDLDRLEYDKRNFYVMSHSIISFNFEPIFLWFRFMENDELNKNPPHIGKRNLPVKLYHDFAVFTAIRDSKKQQLEAYYPVNETVARHINGIENGGCLFRICKFYYVHGSTNIRECENCGKMMIILGEWSQISEELFSPPPFRTNLFKRTPRTKEERDAYGEGKYDAVQCPFCSNMTYAHNSTMIMQTAYKGGHTSFLEEIQRDAKVSLSGAKHIILMGYQLPPDDAVWRSAIVAKQNKKDVYCSVVVGCSGEHKWIKGEELVKYVKEKKKSVEKEKWAEYGVNAIDAAIAIFGEGHVRAYTGGIPQVWCSGGTADKDKVRDLLYPSNIFPNGVANMRIENWEKI